MDGLYLAPAARRQGSARRWSRGQGGGPTGLTLWTFAANAAARRFYAAQGFVELRRTDGDNEEGLPDILLAWPGAA